MLQVDVDAAEAFAPRLTITHQETADVQPFVMTWPQVKVMRTIAEHPRVIVLKGRQTYISTCCCYYAVMFAAVNPGLKVALVADIADKAKGLLAKATAWAKEAGFPTKAPTNTEILTLWNGAEIHAVTANSNDQGANNSKEVKAGRSFSYGLIILSEFAFYTRDKALLAAITRSALKGAHIVIESTATPAENAFRAIWDKGRGWRRVFLSVEDHAAYQLPEDATWDKDEDAGGDEPDELILDDATWADLQAKYEFKSRTHAAYWWRMVQTDMNGDVHRGLREAPIIPAHAFAFAEGRWIFRFDDVEPPTDGAWSFYEDADESGCILAVDTASGVGADASAIVVIGRERGNLLATYRSNTVKVPDFIPIVRAAMAKWLPFATIVEGNGIGKGVFQDVSNTLGTRVYEHTSHDAEKPVRMNLVKLAIEGGEIAVGPELEHEVKHSMMLKPRRNGGGPLFDGPDDLLNALGFALVYRREHPWRSKVVQLNPRTHVDRTAYRKSKTKKVF